MNLTDYFIITTIALYGLIFGSFINVVIYRMYKGDDIIRGRSKCPKCKKTLKVLDLIPVFSYVFLKGKCRYCHKKISFQYPIVELSSAAILLVLYYNLSLIRENILILNSLADIYLFIFLGFICLSLFTVFVYDLMYYLIPDEVVIPAFLVTVVLYLYLFFSNVVASILPYAAGMILYSGFFAIQYFVSKGKWVGFGDIKLGLLLGLLLGWQLSLVSLLLAYLGGSVVSIVLIASGKKTRKDIIPFGPFLIGSVFVTFLYGGAILSWYLGLALR